MSFQQSRTIKRESSEGYISDKSSSNEAVDQLSPEANERAGRRYVAIEQLLLTRIDEQNDDTILSTVLMSWFLVVITVSYRLLFQVVPLLLEDRF